MLEQGKDWEPSPSKNSSLGTAMRSMVLATTIITVAATSSSENFQESPEVTSRLHKTPKFQYPHESIKWYECPGNYSKPLWRLECAEVEVPQDHFDETNVETLTIPLIRSRGRRGAAKNVLFNPGGPGGSGYDFVWRSSWLLHPRIGEDFHLVSFDPRGVGQSRPRIHHPLDTATFVPTNDLSDLPPGASHIHMTRFLTSRLMINQMLPNMSNHDQYVNTPQTAADMNTILDSLGQDYMYYWGLSYGSILGQTYATMYPDRVERMVLDGIANQFQWYLNAFADEAFHDTWNAMMDFAQQCFDSQDQCALSAFPKTKEDARKLVSNVFFPPTGLDAGNHNREMNEDRVRLAVSLFHGTYAPGIYWNHFAESLAMWLVNNTAEAHVPLFPDGASQQNESASKKNSSRAHYIVTLNDKLKTGAFSSTAMKAQMNAYDRQLGRYRIMGTLDGHGPLLPTTWPLRKTHSYEPRSHVTTRHPILLLSTTNDPITPLISAQKARDVFEGSRILQINGTGHASVSVPSMVMAKKMIEYIRNGTLPEEHLEVCDQDKDFSPFMPVGKRIRLLLEAKKVFEGDETEEDRLQFVVKAGALALKLPPWF